MIYIYDKLYTDMAWYMDKQHDTFSNWSVLDSLFCTHLQDSSWTRMGRRLKVFLRIGFIQFGRRSGTLKLLVLMVSNAYSKMKNVACKDPPMKHNGPWNKQCYFCRCHYCRFCSCHDLASPMNRRANMNAHLNNSTRSDIPKRYIQEWWADPMLANQQRLEFTCHWSIVGSLSSHKGELICRFPGCLKVTVYL